ncbi:MAG: CHAT domain-containing protein, partial [Leptolyngbyaceae bacterium]|nr:CHAT domain-containing protein [Leptolyngbyaceae bacterium]
RWEELESATLSIDTLQAGTSTSDEKSESAEITEQLIRLTEEFEELQSQGSDAQQRVESELTLEEIQANLDDNTILLEYWLGDAWQSNSQSYLWAISKPGVISPSGFLSFRIDADRQAINEMARTYYDYLTDPSQRFKPVSVARAGMKLSQTLLGPIADQLEDQRLVVVADGMLRYIPFNALPDPNADQRFMNRAIADVDLDDLPDPLIRNHEIVHLPSFSTLLRIRERAEERDVGSQTLAIITDPKLENTGLEAERILDIARKEDRDLERSSVSFEASQIAFSETGSRVYFSDQDLAEYRLIHFATHGRVFDTNLAESGLTASLVDAQGVLSDEPNLFLSIPDVFRFNLPADLVVLSACRTGLGEEVTGEGMVGFSQGFLAAGASGIVVSLWSVNDEATRVLMEEFYDELFNSLDTSRNTPQSASALRHAQLRLWDERRWNLPYYWAGFTFQGEWR